MVADFMIASRSFRNKNWVKTRKISVSLLRFDGLTPGNFTWCPGFVHPWLQGCDLRGRCCGYDFT